jgi:phospholipid/cholesterol/gamma-HCH transport system substrate-binding protein
MKASNLGAKMVGLGLIALGAVIILAYYYGAAGGTLPFSGSKYAVSATVREPQGLQKHADVRASGVKVGSVDDIKPVGSFAQVKLKLDKNVAPLYRDATVLVRQKTLVGENYIEISRGHARSGALPDGASLPLSQDQEAVPLDRILNSLDAKTRKHISATLQGLGASFSGRASDTNRLLAALRPTLTDGSQVTSILDSQRAQVTDIVDQAGTIFQAVSDRSSAMRSLITSAKSTAQAVAARDAALRESFAQFPSTLNQAKSSVAKLSRFSTRATPVVDELRSGLVALRPVLADLKPTADATKRLFDQLGPLLKVANPMLSRLRTFSDAAGPTFPALNTMLRQVNPALDYLKPYSKDAVAFTSNFGLNHFYDQSGALGYCTCPINDRSFSNWTPAMRKAVSVLLDEGLISKLVHVDNNPVRKPGLLPKSNAPFSGTYPRVAEAPAP